MKVLVPFNTTPTGFGIAQAPSGDLFALSPCCGFAIGKTEGCANCGETYNQWGEDNCANVYNVIRLDNHFLEMWVNNLLGVAATVEMSS